MIITQRELDKHICLYPSGCSRSTSDLGSYLNEPLKYVTDKYFDAEKIFEYRYDLPTWDYKNKTPSVFHVDLGENIKAVKVLALQSEGCADFQDIPEGTEIPERTLLALHQSLEIRRLPRYHPGALH